MDTANITRERSRSLPPIVLIVDDHADTLEMYSSLLSSEGYWAATASTAHEAFAYAQDVQPDAVVTDLGLPGPRDGVDLIRELQAHPTLGQVPIVAVTGREPREVPSLAGVQISALLLKPVSPRALVTRVSAAIQQSHDLRLRSDALRERIPELLKRSSALLLKSSGRDSSNAGPARECPSCGAQLSFIESGVLSGIEYEYYQWCRNRCGLYCYNRRARAFERLAPLHR
jgi:CheY-like chemotaxis protein